MISETVPYLIDEPTIALVWILVNECLVLIYYFGLNLEDSFMIKRPTIFKFIVINER